MEGLKNCGPELSSILTDLLNICMKEYSLPIAPVSKSYMSETKNDCIASFSVESNFHEKLAG